VRSSEAQPSWRRVLAAAVELGLPVTGFSAAHGYYDGDRLPANLLHAQRDYFGAHTYQRGDKPGTLHTDWIRERKLK
jgi:6-phosphogluconate dehydrogenase